MAPAATAKMMAKKITKPQMIDLLRFRRSRNSHDVLGGVSWSSDARDGRGAYGAGVVCVPWSTALASSSMWTAAEKRFQKNWSLALAIVYVEVRQIGWTG